MRTASASTQSWTAGLLIPGLTLLLASAASAATVTHRVEFPSRTIFTNVSFPLIGPFALSADFPQFDPALGTLNVVTFEALANFRLTIRTQAPGGSADATLTGPVTVNTVPFYALDASATGTGIGSTTVVVDFATTNPPRVLDPLLNPPDQPAFDAFKGSGTATVLWDASAELTPNSASADLELIGNGPSYFSVTYDYTPPVVPTGACCDGAGGCTIGPASGCAGSYQGDGSDCSQGCGACCASTGGCTNTLPGSCSGTFVASTFCAATPDPCVVTPPTGACCDGAGGCSVVEASACTGNYQGDGSDCSRGCGACCARAGGCTNTLPGGCSEVFVASTFCAATPDPCAVTPPTGACCDGAGRCSVVEASACSGNYQGDGSDCASGCGACCSASSGCTDTLARSCTGTFVAGSFCAATPDPCVADCFVASLLSLGNTLLAVRSGAGQDLSFSWVEPLAAPSEYHVNHVAMAAQIAVANRAPGPASPSCTVAAPASGCSEPLGLTRPGAVGFYQALAACGPLGSDEGPF